MAESRSVERVYRDLWDVRHLDPWFGATLREPRGPDVLFAMVDEWLETHHLGAQETILDVGCGQGHYACQLAERYRRPVVAFDLVTSNLEAARELRVEQGLGPGVSLYRGGVEALALASGSVALIWCRCVLIHVAEVERALGEMWRVLKPGGGLLLHIGYATEHLTPEEAAALCRRMSFVPANLTRGRTAAMAQQLGFRCLKSEDLGGEFAEFYQQQDGRCARELLAIARLYRHRRVFVEQFGEDVYETALGMYHWQVYQLLGKIGYHAYLLQKD